MAPIAPELSFLQVTGGQRLCAWHAPRGVKAQGAVLYLHPFAEEMNKCRRMAAMQSRALAAAGFGVLQIDLLGCGDSSGDFGDATWQAWLDDAAAGVDELLRRCGDAPLWLWGARAGALLACAARSGRASEARLLLWQPALQGRGVLQQFLRLKAAADMANGGKGVVEGLRRKLSEGQPVEVAGYVLHPAMAAGLEAANLAAPANAPSMAICLEVSSRDEPRLGPATQTQLDVWRSQGWHVDARAVRGPAFWQTVEMEDAPDLIDATTRAMQSCVRVNCEALAA